MQSIFSNKPKQTTQKFTRCFFGLSFSTIFEVFGTGLKLHLLVYRKTQTAHNSKLYKKSAISIEVILGLSLIEHLINLVFDPKQRHWTNNLISRATCSQKLSEPLSEVTLQHLTLMVYVSNANKELSSNHQEDFIWNEHKTWNLFWDLKRTDPINVP